MPRSLREYRPVILVFVVLMALITLTLRPYGGNPSALFHIDAALHQQHPMPAGTVVLGVVGYDGMEYLQIARNVPKIVTGQWRALRLSSPGSYAYQRILLPIVAYALAFGQDAWLPYSFLLINGIALLGSCILLLRRKIAPLYAIALSLCPAALVGLHFSLAEPLSLLLTTAFLVRQTTDRRGIRASATIQHRWDGVDLALLSALVLSREINIFFILALGIFLLYKKQYRVSMLLLVPITVFLLWHGIIFGIFHQIPFLMSTDKKTIPLTAIVELLAGKRGYNTFTLSSIALFLLFVLPATAWTASLIVRRRSLEFLPSMTLVFLLIMLAMPDHIWGSITSIGRVITPLYPLFVLLAARERSGIARTLTTLLILLGVAAGLGLALIVHPFTVA